MSIVHRSITVMGALLLPALAAGQSLTLEQVLQAALHSNQRIRQYEERLSQKKTADKAAWGNFLPVAKIQASYNRLNEPLAIDLDPIRAAMLTMQAGNQTEMANIYSLLQGRGALSAAQRQALNAQYSASLDGMLPPFSMTFKEEEYKSAAVIALQPLFMGGKLVAGVRFASAEEQAAGAELAQVRNQVYQQCVDHYLSVALLQQVVATRQEVLEGMGRHREDARRLFDEGLIARYHLLRAEVAVAEAERALLDDQNRLDLARMALGDDMGLESASVLTAADTLSYAALADSLSRVLHQAGDQQPLLKMIAVKKQAASQKGAVARADLLPEVAGFGKYELYPEYLSAIEPRWVVGIQANWTLFNGFKRMHNLQEAVHLQREVEHLQKSAEQQVDLWVRKAWHDMEDARTRYEKLAATQALAEENLRLNDKRFQSGLGTSLEVIDARLACERVTLDQLASLRGYYAALADLFAAAGQPEQLLAVWNRR